MKERKHGDVEILVFGKCGKMEDALIEKIRENLEWWKSGNFDRWQAEGFELWQYDKSGRRRQPDMFRQWLLRSAELLYSNVNITLIDPDGVYTEPLPCDIWAAFFVLRDRYDVEAALKFYSLYRHVPIVAVSEAELYLSMAIRFNAYGYLSWPLGDGELEVTLKRCAANSRMAG